MAKETENKEKVLTGYEGTGQEDTFGQIEGENIAPPVKKEDEPKGPKAKEQKKETPGATGIQEDRRNPDFQEEEIPDASDEFAFLNENKSAEKKEEEEEVKEEEKEEEEEKPIFAIDELDQELEAEKTQTEQQKKFDWKKFGKNFEIELDENDPDKFISAVKTKIDEAKTKTEVDVSKYGEDSQKVIRHLEQGGTLEELMAPLAKIDKYLGEADDDTLLRDYYMNREKMTEDQADEKISELHENETYEEQVEKVTKLLKDFRQSKFNDILSTSADKAAKREKEISDNRSKELKAMTDVVDKTETFMGIKLTDEVKTYIKKEISTGKLAEKNNNARTQVFARLFELFGEKIIASFQKQVKDASREGFNTGKQKELEKTHNIVPTSRTPAASEQKNRKSEDPLAGFRNIDEDTIEVT